MITWLWKNSKTGEVVEGDSPVVPPTKSRHWVRIYKVGIGQVSGGGSSPARSS